MTHAVAAAKAEDVTGGCREDGHDGNKSACAGMGAICVGPSAVRRGVDSKVLGGGCVKGLGIDGIIPE